MPHNTASIRMMRKTLLYDCGSFLAQRTNRDDPPVETRRFSLLRSEYVDRRSDQL
jgi:hypothetical protein